MDVSRFKSSESNEVVDKEIHVHVPALGRPHTSHVGGPVSFVYQCQDRFRKCRGSQRKGEEDPEKFNYCPEEMVWRGETFFRFRRLST